MAADSSRLIIAELLILGCGFTGRRVAARFIENGFRVLATTRDPQRLLGSGVEIVALPDLSSRLESGTLVLHSIPPSGPGGLLDLLGDKPSRVVYLSSTAVYGSATIVDQATSADPSTPEARARIEAEHRARRGSWSWLILRPAAIYGPGRGAQERVRRGEFNLSPQIVSRIHVDDLAAHIEAALLSELTGAWPAADEEPCSSREITEFCARLLGVAVPRESNWLPSRTSHRRVDGSAIRNALGITLRYPSFRTGIPAALKESP